MIDISNITGGTNMKPIIFVRVADMKYYRGITENDTPFNGGSYVKETGNAHECYNFEPIIEDGQDYEKCIGFSMMSGGKGVSQLHIEKIAGCKLAEKEEAVDNVYVVFVSKAMGTDTMRVVGFYKNATVYRHPHYMTFENGYEQEYYFESAKENCVLLPYSERHRSNTWFVPTSSSKYNDFGFGRSNTWYVGGKGASQKEIEYVEKIIDSIEEYQGENWMYKEVQ
jgi:hypothetical protein